jgi:hypothetical protein
MVGTHENRRKSAPSRSHGRISPSEALSVDHCSSISRVALNRVCDEERRKGKKMKEEKRKGEGCCCVRKGKKRERREEKKKKRKRERRFGRNGEG